MKKFLHSGDAYICLDKLTRRFETWIQARCKPGFGYSGEMLAQRLAQVFVEHNLNPYMAECGKREANGEYPLPNEDARLSYDGLTIDQREGSVNMSVRLFSRSLGHFFMHWFHVLLYLLPLSARSTKQPLTSATLLFGVGKEALFDLEQGNDRRFVNYCKSSPITPLRQAGNLIVQSATRSGADMQTEFIYARHPIHCLLRNTSFGAFVRMKILASHTAIIFGFLAALLRNPLLVLLARDVAYLPMIRALDAHGKIEELLLTNSAHSRQPLWMRNPAGRSFKVHMIWYSQNIFPFVFKGDSEATQFPTYRHLCIDEHWVWTQSFADYLTEIGVGGEKHVTGPILWYLPETDESVSGPGGEGIQLAVFDIVPVNEQRSNNIGFLNNYYSPDVVIKFLEDVVNMAEELRRLKGKPVEVLLKCKRGYNFRHHSQYVNRVNELADEGSIKIVPFQTNLYSMIGQCDVSIVMPNSSPALVSAHMNKKAVYYDPTARLVANHEVGPNILSASSPSALLESIVSVVDDVF